MTERQLVAVVEDAAREGSWNAAAWLLERKWPERWAKRAKPKPAPEREKPADPFAEIDELAERRAG